MVEVVLYAPRSNGPGYLLLDRMKLEVMPRKGERIYVHYGDDKIEVAEYKINFIAYTVQGGKVLAFLEEPLFCIEPWNTFIKGIIYEG